MILSEKWLREWVNPPVDTQQLADSLTMAGLEVDSITPVAKSCTQVVVGLVESVARHPDADKLSVCQVSDGRKTYQVVCGAPNVRSGLKVPFALVGAVIGDANSAHGDKGPLLIRAASIRGIESNGMLCSAEELGLSEGSSGLLELDANAVVGEDIRHTLNLDDVSIELDLTPNRGDCLGVLGLAREVGVLTKTDVVSPVIGEVSTSITDEFPVTITAVEQCPRYLGRVIRGVNLDAETPAWMSEKLRRSGLRSIDPIVDVTNFVLLEMGQPMHAFDLAKLRGRIDVRLARPNETLTLLDGKAISLTPDSLLITDESGPVALAGIMGGLSTAVSESTADVFLECAYFAPLAVAGKARTYGLHTDASHRYERGVDYNLQHLAMQRATELLLEIVGGSAGPVTEVTGKLPASQSIELRYRAVSELLGIDIPISEIKDILARLGLKLESESETGLRLSVPSFRFDLGIEADLIEELARVYGYNRLPKTPGMLRQVLKTRPERRLDLARMRHQLVALGYQEAITYSFIDPELSASVCGGQSNPIALQNPISAEMSVMRPSLLPGLLATLKYNLNRQQDRVRLFETGLVFTAQQEKVDGAYSQIPHLAGLIYGREYPENWINNKVLVDFYNVKGDVETLLELGGKAGEFSFEPCVHPTFHPGQAATVVRKGVEIGRVGAIHPAVQRELGLDKPVYLFELCLEPLLEAELPASRELSRFPEVHRDLAIVIGEETAAAAITELIREIAGDSLVSLRIFDVYQGDAVAKGKKSIALGLTWQHPSRTLSDEEINTIISSCVNALQDKFNADLRN